MAVTQKPKVVILREDGGFVINGTVLEVEYQIGYDPSALNDLD
jgi:hypothetical protein